MFPSSVARIIHTCSTAAIKRRRLIPVSSLAVKRIYQYRHSQQQQHQQHQHYFFSTNSKTSTAASQSATTTKPSTATTQDEELPSAATTGIIASHLAPIPTERDLALVGGVFALTSAKRDKLGELKNQLGEEEDSLDDKATDEELLDLHLADGMKLVATLTDAGSDAASSADMKVLNEFSAWLDAQHDPSDEDNDDFTLTSMEIKLELISAKLDNLLEEVPPSQCLQNIRDYLDPAVIREELKDAGEDENLFANTMSNNGDSNNPNMDCPSFRDAVTRYRLLLAKSAIDRLSNSWKILTTVSDGDIDRAAAGGIALEPELETVSFSKVLALLQKHVSGSCSERMTAAWDLMDRDQDGSLDEAEMNHVVHLCLDIEVEATQALFQECLDAFPVRAPLSAIGSEDLDSVTPQGWRQKRREKNAKKKLVKMFQQTRKRHFDVEIEINHRLRCIYAWANKVDQGNRMKSVLVDEQAGWTGRKRYVELSPKISEAEFREVQEIHFKHLDRLGTEIVTSFREDLWVLQGKGRERKELIKNSFLFLGTVSAIDAVIIML
mmetsp:Transcript_27922/g.61505  ORF Transcript_27922/g.61505 Transcript_27922/m.61505 type:complete len:552 (+) Transcript_27922:235-1890(+)